jgi:outer membrane protein
MRRRSGFALGLAAATLTAGAAPAQSRTLQEALATTYANNPTLQAQRASLRATDENVPAALSGWRPQVVVAGSAGPTWGTVAETTTTGVVNPAQETLTSSQKRNQSSVTLTVTQPIYRGGHTTSSTSKAENGVRAGRAQLIATEQSVFSDTVTAFVNVIQDEQILALDVNNEQVLTRQLQATNDRFRVGEITRTDVAQAEAALASATATRQTAEGNLQTARSAYQRLVGEFPGKLIEPQPLRLPTRTLEEAKTLAASNNPNVVAALFNDAAAKDNFNVAYSAIMPNLSLQGQAFRNQNLQLPGVLSNGAAILGTLSMPIYQGGSEYAGIRQARQQEQQARKQLDDARRTAVDQATSAWETYTAAKATIDSNRAAIRANQIALEGVQREAIVGSRTTLDVLNAEQTLLNSRVTLVQALANLVTASYQVASAVGRLTARDLNLQVPLYDPRAYYNEVRDRWIGTGDFATSQPGR